VNEQTSPVVIVGAGPVGMTLALDLAARDIDVTIVEQRAPDARGDAKCNSVAARTMEVFRRLGVADAVRAAGLADQSQIEASRRVAAIWPDLAPLHVPVRRFEAGIAERETLDDSDTEEAFLVAYLTPLDFARVAEGAGFAAGAVRAFLDETVEQARENLRLAEERYRVGAGTILETIEAGVQLTTAQSSLIQAQIDYAIAKADLKRAAGRDVTVE